MLLLPGRTSRVLRWLDTYVTVEPVMACFYVSTAVSNVVVQNLMIYKSCWPNAPPPSMSVQCPDETSAQSRVAGIASWKPLILYLLPVVFVACAGPWSDRHGRRKPLYVIPMVGQIVSDLCLTATVLWWKETSPEIVAVAETLPAALTGGRGVLGIGLVSYIVDVTTVKERTVRMSVVVACIFVGTPVGAALAGVCNRYLGFLGVLLLVAAINGAGLLYAVCRLQEPPTLKPSNATGVRTVLRMLLNPRMFLVVVTSLFVLGPLQGEYSVLYLFLRYKFQWTEVDYSLYAAFKLSVIFAGTLLTVFVLSKIFKLKDSLIGIISCITQSVASCLYLAINTGWLMYLVPIAEMLHGASLAVQKSIASKMVDPSEIGQLNALLSLSEAVVPLIIFPLYNQVYQHTFQTFPAAFFGLSGLLTLAALLAFSWLYVLSRKESGLNFVSEAAETQDQQEDPKVKESSSKIFNI